jgi:Rap1a immunity proteins
MKMYRMMAVASFFLMMTSDLAFSDFAIGNKLVEQCKQGDEKSPDLSEFPYGYCVGYIMAIADASHCGHGIDGFTSDIPKKTSVLQLKNVVLSWLKKHPTSLSLAANKLVAGALSDSYPCKR